MSDEKIVSSIFGLPLERIIFLRDECGMPLKEEELSLWFQEDQNAELILEEKRIQFAKLLNIPVEATST